MKTLLVCAVLGVASASSLRKHGEQQGILQERMELGSEMAGGAKCKKGSGDCKTPEDIVNTFEREWEALSKAYGITDWNPTFQAGTAVTLYGCRPPGEALSDFDMWERSNEKRAASKAHLEKIAKKQKANAKVPLDLRFDGKKNLLGFEVLLENAGKIVDDKGNPLLDTKGKPIIKHEYDIWDGIGKKEKYAHLTGKSDIVTAGGVKFSAIGCKDLIEQKKELAGQTAKERAHGLKGGLARGAQKLKQDKTDIACITWLLNKGKKGPCDQAWISDVIKNKKWSEFPLLHDCSQYLSPETCEGKKANKKCKWNVYPSIAGGSAKAKADCWNVFE